MALHPCLCIIVLQTNPTLLAPYAPTVPHTCTHCSMPSYQLHVKPLTFPFLNFRQTPTKLSATGPKLAPSPLSVLLPLLPFFRVLLLLVAVLPRLATLLLLLLTSASGGEAVALAAANTASLLLLLDPLLLAGLDPDRCKKYSWLLPDRSALLLLVPASPIACLYRAGGPSTEGYTSASEKIFPAGTCCDNTYRGKI